MDFGQLMDKYLTNSITQAEKEQLFYMIRSGEHAHALKAAIDVAFTGSMNEQEDVALREHLFARVQQRKQRARVINRSWWYAAAAVVAAVIVITFIWPRPHSTPALTAQKTNIAPGTSKARLTLADGSVITLDSNGQQIIQQGATAVRQQGGQLLYHAQGTNATLGYNTLSTPRGGQFQVQLPDGTKVWLNAASSLRYPTAFTGKERAVAITGEAYFEVAANASMPFRVSINGQPAIEVLGTSFNVNAYTDENAVQTTLLEGSVRVINTILQPGQQASVINNKVTVKEHADIEQVTAWKNGLFNFNKQDLPSVMKQLARWYDVEVVYQGNIQSRQFFGEIERSLQLAEVLEILQKAEVHFKIEGRKLIVTP